MSLLNVIGEITKLAQEFKQEFDGFKEDISNLKGEFVESVAGESSIARDIQNNASTIANSLKSEASGAINDVKDAMGVTPQK